MDRGARRGRPVGAVRVSAGLSRSRSCCWAESWPRSELQFVLAGTLATSFALEAIANVSSAAGVEGASGRTGGRVVTVAPFHEHDQNGSQLASLVEFIPSVPAFVSLNRDLGAAVAADTAKVAMVRAFDRPVRIVWGARDPYLNAGMARSFTALFPSSQLFLLPARHYLQIDQPASVAHLLLSVPLARSRVR